MKIPWLIWTIIVIGCICIFSYYAYSLNRWWNWKFGYEYRTKVVIEKVMNEHIEKYHKGEKTK